METLLITGLMILNFGICWWDARVAGLIWQETKAQEGFMRLVAWSAAVQSAFGFTLVFAVLLALLARGLHLLSPAAMRAMMDLTYLLIIVPLLGSGLVITIHSYIVASRERSLLSQGVAAWNTFAMVDNAIDAMDGIGEAFSDLLDSVKSDDHDDDGVNMAVVLLLVVLALGGGITLTYAIVRSSMQKSPVPNSRAA